MGVGECMRSRPKTIACIPYTRKKQYGRALPGLGGAVLGKKNKKKQDKAQAPAPAPAPAASSSDEESDNNLFGGADGKTKLFFC